MANIFSSIIKYQPKDSDTAIDPKENRATEVLAAALNLSDLIKEDFLKLLSDEGKFFELDGVDKYKIETQYRFEHDFGEGFFDIFIQSEEIKEQVNIVVEVKVGSKQDQSQIDKYEKWLKKEKPDYRIFHLVVSNAGEFRNGGKYRVITWQDLCERLKKLSESKRAEKEEPDSTDKKIAQNLISYLNEEGIVSMWKPEQMKSFSEGLKARNALSAFFERLKSIYEEKGYETKIELPSRYDKWPSIRLGKKEWSDYFGDAKVIFVYFMVEGIWGATGQEIYSEIKLFNKYCYPKESWDKIKINIPKWEEFLRENKRYEIEKEKKENGQAYAWKKDFLKTQEQFSKKTAEELVEEFKRIIDEISKDIDVMLGQTNKV
ncbi:PD-(D/E)XK nuclease family protein [Oscillatoria amoena NRMC-F 0135]|nr:PD-(D/E)XK nuclease family protein [Oscillatoria amoena NRMC-F 0135]